MLNRYLKIILISLLLTGSAAVTAQSSVDPAARAVAEAYFDALQAGDLQALLTLLTGQERARSQERLSDPDYSLFLVERYRNARLEITASGVQSGFLFVDIAIRLNDLEAVRERLILEPSSDPAVHGLTIVGRKEISH
jgi:hypothetical protein